MEDSGTENHWVADRSSARSAATALLIQELRRGRLVVLGVALTLLLATLLLVAGRTEQDHDPLYALAFSVALIGILVACAIGFAQLQRHRVLRAQLPPGLEMSSRFGPDHIVLRRQWSESTTHFDGYAALEVVHGWVLLRRRETRTQVMIPEQLVPPHDLARLRLVIAGYRPRDQAEGGAAPDDDETPDDGNDDGSGDTPTT